MGELNWIFTAITDTIAWNTLPRDLFQQLFRADLLTASLCRNFLLADKILRYCNFCWNIQNFLIILVIYVFKLCKKTGVIIARLFAHQQCPRLQAILCGKLGSTLWISP